MRAEELPPLLITLLEGLTVDNPVSVADKFVNSPDITPGEARPNGSFRLEVGSLSPPKTFAPQRLGHKIRIVFSFTDGPGIAARLVSVGERVIAGLCYFVPQVQPTAPGVQALVFESDWEAFRVSRGPEAFKGTQPNEIECALVVRIEYDLTGV